MIYVIGDSHVAIFSIYNDQNYMLPLNKMCKSPLHSLCSYRTDPHTAYNLINKINEFEQIIRELDIKDEDILIFSYGEVDIRCHIGFHNSYGVESVVNSAIENYLRFLLHFKKKYNVGVWGPIASGADNGMQGNGRPSFKTSIERNKITKMFNNRLEERCDQHNIIFKSIFKTLLSNDRDTNTAYYVDGVHLNIHAQPLVFNEFKDLLPPK